MSSPWRLCCSLVSGSGTVSVETSKCPRRALRERCFSSSRTYNNSGASYGTLNTARSALAVFLHTDISGDRLIGRLLKGVFRLRPPTPKYTFIWDVSPVLQRIQTALWPLDTLSLARLTVRLTVLLAICTAQRLQTLTAIQLDHCHRTAAGYQIAISALLKTSRPGAPPLVLDIPPFRRILRCASL